MISDTSTNTPDSLDEFTKPTIPDWKKGRYKARRAASILFTEEEGISQYDLEDDLIRAIEQELLDAYEPDVKSPRYKIDKANFKDAKLSFRQKLQRLEMYWDDLNKWIEMNHRHIVWRFPDPLALKILMPATSGAKKQFITNPTPEQIQQYNDLTNQRIQRLSVQRQQEEVIIKTIISLGYDPKALPPKPKQGNKWVRAEIWAVFKDSNEFTTSTFANAWFRLKKTQEILEIE